MHSTSDLNESDLVYALRSRIRDLEKALGADWRAPKALGLTHGEERLLGVIVAKRGFAKLSAIYDVLYGEAEDPPDDNVVAVQLHRIRSKCKPHGIAIVTLRGAGFEITPDNLERLNALYGEGERQ